ncbi:G-type lectin S-receptor-like serine/threonine-protein kinase [Populus alba x Populus x berolinensis]|uniref:non-specific serine/threonine protein kinase n=1 Tax=Populus alba x Populus x berolinensis TaxID=444605 RepID=A0AAD6Q5W4_9ROSI|nr:G-type lectin S-receptor-like serine/threonine-protein kinase [Populus alba x Populus x berolinensis]
MYDQNSGWTTIYSVPVDTCENYGQCGANGICRTRTSPICQCLEGFRSIPEEELDIQNFYGSRKCEARLTLDCQPGEGFLKLPGVKLPDLLEFRLNESMNLKECEAECFKNCSCSAFAASNLSGGGDGSGCLMWFGNLIDIREQSGSTTGQDIHIRVPASELEMVRSSKRKKMLKTALVASMSALLGIFVSGLVLCIGWRKIKRKVGKDRRKEGMETPLFDLDTIATATNNFATDSIIGAGGFGSVYKVMRIATIKHCVLLTQNGKEMSFLHENLQGKLLTGQEIAVKKLSMNSGQGVEEFRNEVVLIAKLQHRNLVGLLGSCIHREERMLIYEYMPNKSLDYFIFDRERSALLGWKERFVIILGIARGLLYLHQDSKLQIVHRDLKPSNVLLDSNLIPKISDFGLARISGDDGKETKTRRVIGTYGYMAPEYAIDGKFSVKSDVFSLGVLLLEIISGKKNRGFVHPDHHHNLLGHAWLMWTGGRASELIDTGLEDTSGKSQLLRCIQVGLLCVQKLPEDRPVMSTVVFMLANEGAVLPQPNQPGFFIERGSVIDAKSRNEDSCSTNEASITILEAR